MKLIDKAAVVAELKKRLKSLQKEYNELIKYQIWASAKDIEPRIEEMQKTVSFIDTLEVKEVDLEKEYKNFVEDDPVYSKLVNYVVGKSIAKHFFELGMAARNKVQKGE